jgi:hypothetical protein
VREILGHETCNNELKSSVENKLKTDRHCGLDPGGRIITPLLGKIPSKLTIEFTFAGSVLVSRLEQRARALYLSRG